MTEEQDQINNLQQKLSDLQKKQELFHSEILQIQEELEMLIRKPQPEVEMKNPDVPPQLEIVTPKLVENSHPKAISEQPIAKGKASSTSIPKPDKSEETIKTDLERFIGENLINKIGIAVTVIGVGIGAKYAIDHQLISPITRIIMGYL